MMAGPRDNLGWGGGGRREGGGVSDSWQERVTVRQKIRFIKGILDYANKAQEFPCSSLKKNRIEKRGKNKGERLRSVIPLKTG